MSKQQAGLYYTVWAIGHWTQKHGQGCTRNIKTFRILMKQEMMGWQWHHLDGQYAKTANHLHLTPDG